MNFFFNNENFSDHLISIIRNYNSDKIFILADNNTFKYCYPLIEHVFLQPPFILKIESGEQAKKIGTIEKLWSKLLELNADRKSLLINLGGGVVSDIGGFVASTFKRGISFINIPTTLLSMVDAAIGGKNGINFYNFKNIIGTFSNPQAVIINSEFLKTLPKEHLISGFAEVVKHSLLDSESAWHKVKYINFDEPDFEYLSLIIKESASFKQKIVESDPKEKGVREILNFGHTFGHAIESLFKNKNKEIQHGEAVAIGIICELFLSNKILNFDFQILFEISEFIAKTFPIYKIEYDDYDLIYDFMKQDKKNKDNKIHFTLLEKIGSPIINQTCEKDEIFQALNFYFQMIG